MFLGPVFQFRIHISPFFRSWLRFASWVFGLFGALGTTLFGGNGRLGRHLGKYSGSIHSHLDGRWGELELVLLSSQLPQSAAASSSSASSSSPSPAISRSLGHFCSNRLLCFTIHSSTSHKARRENHGLVYIIPFLFPKFIPNKKDSAARADPFSLLLFCTFHYMSAPTFGANFATKYVVVFVNLSYFLTLPCSLRYDHRPHNPTRLLASL